MRCPRPAPMPTHGASFRGELRAGDEDPWGSPGECRNPGSALFRGGGCRPWRGRRRLTLQLKGLPGSLPCRRPSSGPGAAPGPFASSAVLLWPSGCLYRQGPAASEEPIGGFPPWAQGWRGHPCPPPGLDRMDPDEAGSLPIHRSCRSSLPPEERPALERPREDAKAIHQ